MLRGGICQNGYAWAIFWNKPGSISRAREDNNLLYVRIFCKRTSGMTDRVSKRGILVARLTGSGIVTLGLQSYARHHLNRFNRKSSYRCLRAKHHGISSIKYSI